MLRIKRIHVIVSAALLPFFGAACRRTAVVKTVPSAPQASVEAPEIQKPTDRLATAIVIFNDGFKDNWQDWGWGPHESPPNDSIRVRFDDWGGLILAKPGNSGDFGGVRFRIKLAPQDIGFIGLRLESDGVKLPDVPLTEQFCKNLGNGWSEVFVPFELLNPDYASVVDRIIFHAIRVVGPSFVEFNEMELTKPGPRKVLKTYDPSQLERVPVKVLCDAQSKKISPYIYGFAYNAFDDETAKQAQWLLMGTIRRWGGNPTTTYNWEAHAWNTGMDWYFENHRVSHETFIKENVDHAIVGAVTVPVMGWVSKDDKSVSFPVSVFGKQHATDPYNAEAGDGKDKGGKNLKAGPQTRAYRAVTPEFVKRWVQAIRRDDQKLGQRSVWMYILDNEPMIWDTTHRDARQEPLGYEELVQRTIDYGSAIRDADPEAIIAGPALWGWTAYMYSGIDMANGGPSVRPDRRRHDDLPVVAYYLRELAKYEKRTGKSVLDVLDLHVYPYADGLSGSRAEPDISALRLRSTRMLWDPSYIDESWVKEPVNVLPRMQQWVDQYYPKKGLSVGEWNFGGERHISGALATAESLGRYAQFGLTSAFYWTYPPANSPVMWAFRAYRDFDGKGSKFLDWYTPANLPKNSPISAFVSRNQTGTQVVAILLNFSPTTAIAANIDLGSCGNASSVRAFSYNAQSRGLLAVPSAGQGTSELLQALAPYSITVLDIQLKNEKRH